jgi:drug/metabolite transporter (DMT)-like permease
MKKLHETHIGRRIFGKGEKMDWMKVLAIAVSAVGLIQLAKGIFKDLPTWIWAVALIPVSVASAAVFFYLPPFIGAALLAVTVGQLGYENIIQPIKKLIGM